MEAPARDPSLPAPIPGLKPEAQEALDLLALAKPYLDRKAADQAEALAEQERRQRATEQADLAELTMFRKRTITAYTEVELGNGDKLRLRAGLTEKEYEFLIDLHARESALRRAAAKAARHLTPEEQDLIDEMERIKIALITFNPLITPEFLKEHAEEYPFGDILTAYNQVMPLITEMARRPEQAAKFRPK